MHQNQMRYKINIKNYMYTFIVILFCLLAFSSLISAHEVRPAYLEIKELNLEINQQKFSSYQFLWKTPAQGEMRLALNVILPKDCHNIGYLRTIKVNAAVVQHWRSQCESGIRGKTISIENLEASLTDVILLYRPIDGADITLRILGSNPQAQIPVRQLGWTAAKTYFSFGVEHILSGIDHLLFVFCLLLLINNRKRLFGAITAFTAAHSITLASTMFGWVHLASAPVEAAIALSIVFLAAEIIHRQNGKKGTIQRWPWLAAFGFGLLHGFGFAAALRDIGLFEEAITIALIFFNLGIEFGQILFVICVLAIWSLWRRYAPNLKHVLSLRYAAKLKYVLNFSPSYLKIMPFTIGVVASYWFLERTIDIFKNSII